MDDGDGWMMDGWMSRWMFGWMMDGLMDKWLDGLGHGPEPALWFPSHLSEQSGPQEAMKPAASFAGTTTGLSERRVPVPRPPGSCAALGGPLGPENQVNTREEEGTHPSAHLSALSIRSGGFS